MADFIGNIAVPEIIPVGVFPITPDFGHGQQIAPQVVHHQFGSGDAKIEQQFYLGSGARRFFVRRATLYETDRIALRDFWEARRGPYGAFTYNRPTPDQSGTTAHVCRFENEPLSWEMLGAAVSSVGVTLVEIPGSSPTYSVNDTVNRFPTEFLKTNLLQQVQELIPLVRIEPREPGYPAIHVSDRRVTLGVVGAQLYLPRLLDVDGISQAMGPESDDARFVFGNADGVMRDLVNDVDLIRARIEFAIFHVGTGIKINLWKGEIVDWDLADGSPEFPVVASDGIYDLNLPYPPRKVSRTCPKIFNDGGACPFASEGALDLAHFPGGNGSECDKGYSTSNGCLAHGMKHRYGAIAVEPQGVRLKDNSSGFFGLGRQRITSVSLVSESIYSQVIPEIYTDSEMPVNCLVAAGRDESEFYDALAIVGEGPLEFGRGHTIDGQYHHGYPGPLGLREVAGNDPAGEQDFFSLGQLGDQTGGDFRKVFDGTNTYLDNFAAGTAFLEIRRSDEKGIQLSRPGDHAVQAIVKGGLEGWVWTAPGARVKQRLTNPFWIAVNMLLRANGVQLADAATCEEYFDVDAAIAAAGVADLMATKVIGSGDETQFKFRGVIGDEKPLRDWIQEVLMNALGYYTFAFGKLKLGIRVNSSVVEAFTLGNIVFRSLRLGPHKPGFNHITANFGDEEFEFANNSLVLYDIDHAKRIGRANAPLFPKGSLNLSGSASKSQAARVMTSRLREELGGINATDWKNGRRISFRTTVLALNVEPGMVCSMTHPNMPGAATLGEFRVTRWRLNKDWSIDIEGTTTTDSMYDLVAGPKPADVAASPFPHSMRDLLPRPPFGWLPDHTSTPGIDPIYDPSEDTFGLQAVYEEAADGSPLTNLVLTGKLPVNLFSSIRQPILSKTVATAPAGGFIHGGRTVFLLICARDGDGKLSQTSEVVSVDVPSGTDTNTITLTVEAWPDGAPGGYEVFAGENRDRLSHQFGFPFNAGAITAITLTGEADPAETWTGLQAGQWGVPDGEFDRLRIKLKRVLHAGVFGQQVGAVTSGSIKVAGGNFAANQWADYVCTILGIWTPNVVSDAGGSASTFLGTGLDDLAVTQAGNGESAIFEVQIDGVGTPDTFRWRKDGGAWNSANAITGGVQNLSDGLAITFGATTGHTMNDLWQIPVAGPLPILNYRIASNNADTLTLAAGDPLADGVKVGDVIVMRHRPTIVTESSIGDPNTQNSFHPDGATNDEAGNLVRILAGAGRGQLRKVVSNTPTSWNVDRPWDVLPDTTSIFIIEQPEWEARTESTPIDVDDPLKDVSIAARADNLLRQIVLVQAVAVDAGSHEAPDEDSPAREIYLFGLPGTFLRNYWKRFVMGDEALAVGDDLMDNRGEDLIAENEEIQYLEWTSRAINGPVGSALTVEISISSDAGANWVEILETTIAAGANDASGEFALPVISKRGYVYKTEVTAVGSTTAGGKWETILSGRLVRV